MIVRSRIVVAAAALTLGLVACGNDDGASVRNIGETEGTGTGSATGTGTGSATGTGTGSATGTAPAGETPTDASTTPTS